MSEITTEKNTEDVASSLTPQTEKPKRNAAIEVCRIVCIIMVIFNHTFNQFYNAAGAAGLFARYVNLLNVCAVGTFFVITGFYLFQGRFTYKQRLKKLLFEIVIPALCIIFLLIIYKTARGCLRDGTAPLDSLRHELFAPVKDLLAWKFSGEYSYLWFILSYIEIIVFYPVYFLICRDDKISNMARRLLMCFCLAKILLEDFSRLADFGINIRTFSLIGAYQFYLLLGYELKLLYEKGKLSEKFCRGAGLTLYFGGIILAAAYILIRSYVFHDATEYWYHLNCHTSILSAAGLFLIFLGVKVKGAPLVYRLGKSVFYVYLIQTPIHIVLRDLNMNSLLFPYIGLLSFIVIALICTLVSFAIGTVISGARRSIVKS